MRRILLGAMMGAVLAAAMPAQAGGYARDPSIDARQHRQQARIAQGVGSGELTSDEARRLRYGQAEIQRKKRRYESDGVLTPTERRDLERDLNKAGRDIYNQTHNADRSF